MAVQDRRRGCLGVCNVAEQPVMFNASREICLVSEDSVEGDWTPIRDLLNPIFRVKSASSRRMSQMQAFWRLTDYTYMITAMGSYDLAVGRRA